MTSLISCMECYISYTCKKRRMGIDGRELLKKEFLHIQVIFTLSMMEKGGAKVDKYDPKAVSSE